MAAQGYIGRSPGESSVIIARQDYSPSGVTTDFTFTSGYTVGYVDTYFNGVRLIEATDFTATDGSTVSLVEAAGDGDVIEIIAYKAFDVGNVTNATGDFTVGNDLTVSNNATISGTLTADGSSLTGIATGVSINAAGGALQRVVLANTTAGVANTMANTGSLYWNESTSTLYATNVNVSGTMTTEDSQNVDATGIVTAGLGLRSTLGGLVVTAGVSTFSAALDINAGVDIDGQTDLDELVVAGVSTFSAAIDAYSIDVDGQADLDEVVVAGVATFSGNTVFSGAIDANSTSDFANTLNVSGGTFQIGTGVTVAAVAGFSTFSKGVKLGKGGLLSEGISSVTAGFDNTSDLNLDNGMVHYTSDNLAGSANTLNLTSSIGINTAMGVNEMIVVTGITSVNNASHYVNALQIDDQTHVVSWVGGSAPTDGGTAGFDTYTFNIWKLGNNMFNIIGNQVKTS